MRIHHKTAKLSPQRITIKSFQCKLAASFCGIIRNFGSWGGGGGGAGVRRLTRKAISKSDQE